MLTRSVFRVDFGNRPLPLRSKGRLYYSLVLQILLCQAKSHPGSPKAQPIPSWSLMGVACACVPAVYWGEDFATPAADG